MKPILEHLPLEPEESFVVKFFDYDYYPTPWHFHPEYELVFVTESTGKRFIGDNISNFGPGDLAFIGPDLPHLFRNDPIYYKPRVQLGPGPSRGSETAGGIEASRTSGMAGTSDPLRAKSIVVHFSESSLGGNLLSLPETRKLQGLFTRSQRGLDITGKTNELVGRRLHELVGLKGFARWIKLVEILHILSESGDCRSISSAYLKGQNELESDRLNTIFEFVMKNFRHSLSVAEVAKMVNLAETSFSRYFSLRTRKTFTSFVNEIRLNHACQLLIENKMSISEICFECGFNNLSNFNRQFRNAYLMNPFLYRKTISTQPGQ
ncbi:MAG TPA: AraC family transcriptional regulator [Puia sp.]|nr:AraC family transcriptional regulator [Puia sp.]